MCDRPSRRVMADMGLALYPQVEALKADEVLVLKVGSREQAHALRNHLRAKAMEQGRVLNTSGDVDYHELRVWLVPRLMRIK